MLQLAVPLLYTLLFCWIIFRAEKWREGLDARWLTFAFLIKVLAGCANLAIWMWVIGRGDSLNYLHDADLIYGTLRENPMHYLQLTFCWGPDNVYPEHLRYISDPLKFSWNNVEYTMVRINTILYMFTFGNAWGNVVILCFLYFLSSVWLLRNIAQFYPLHLSAAFIVLLLFPSLTLWSSGLLKEGPVLMLVQIIFGSMLRLSHRYGKSNLLVILICLVLLLFVREYYTMVLVPLLILWQIARKGQRPAWMYFSGTAVAGLLLIGIADRYSYSFNVSEIICEAQQYFILYEDDPDYTYHVFTGYELTEPLTQLPGVINNILFRPNLLHSSNIFRIYMSLELMLFWLLLIYLLLRVKGKLPALFWMWWSVAAVLLLLYGYVVTDADTMSRYRSIPQFLLLLSLLLCSPPLLTDLIKLNKKISD